MSAHKRARTKANGLGTKSTNTNDASQTVRSGANANHPRQPNSLIVTVVAIAQRLAQTKTENSLGPPSI